MSALLELAERCEAATGPDVVLTKDIADFAESAGLLSVGMLIPNYTAFIDAAMTLVPEGWTAWELRSRHALSSFVAEITRLSENDGEEEGEIGRAKTPALALCAAALRARAA